MFCGVHVCIRRNIVVTYSTTEISVRFLVLALLKVSMLLNISWVKSRSLSGAYSFTRKKPCKIGNIMALKTWWVMFLCSFGEKYVDSLKYNVCCLAKDQEACHSNWLYMVCTKMNYTFNHGRNKADGRVISAQIYNEFWFPIALG